MVNSIPPFFLTQFIIWNIKVYLPALKGFILNITKYFFLLIFLGFFGSITFFEHVHVVDGITIVHSHPFRTGNSGNPVHGHPLNGFVLVHHLMSFVALTAFLVSAACILPVLFRKINSWYHSTFIRQHPSGLCFRGPPVLS